MKTKFMLLTTVMLILSISLVGCGEPKGVYKGNIYVAGHGGHIADATVSIDPTDTKKPFKIPTYAIWTGDKLHPIHLGRAATHGLHDVRVDNQNPNTLFWSNYRHPDSKLIVGKADAVTGKWTAEKVLDMPKEVMDFKKTDKVVFYCGSGQSAKYYFPIFMGYPAFIDVIDKATLELKHRVMLASNPKLPVNYKFTHGFNSPDNKVLFLSVNEAAEPHGDHNGKQHFYLIDIPALENGQLNVLAKNMAEFPKGTITFRGSFTPDGKQILLAGRTRSLVLNAADLSVVKDVPVPAEPAGIENHDIVTSPDGKYGIATLRVDVEVDGKKIKDGQIALLDVNAGKWIGGMQSVCRHCHAKSQKGTLLKIPMKIVGCDRCHLDPRSYQDIKADQMLCGADARWRK
ncbi:MAG: hypothetical protein QMD07_02140 [Thermodesulfovibrionales bacterium]|nr:hypothetical protein [Thermodesulfovibrionales bacterium]